jgi:diguanylate cyclase (GGDEF)-like protein
LSYLFHLVVSQGLTYFIFSWIIFLIWRTTVKEQYLLYWAVGFLFGSFGWLINLIPTSYFPSEELFWIVDISITLISVSAVSYGLVLRSKRPLNIIWFIVGGFAALHWIVYFSSIQYDYGLKMAISPWFVAVCMQLNVYVLWRKEGVVSKIEQTVAVICQISALIHLARGILLANQSAETEAYLLSAFDIVSYLLLPTIYTATGISLLILVIFDMSEQVNNVSITDQQTGTLNRRGVEETCEKVMAHCQRSQQWVSLILTDIDNFGTIKEQYGNNTANLALMAFRDTLNANLRKGDYIGRLEDEEFILILPVTDEAGAMQMAERMRLAVGQICVENRNQDIRFTASFGVVSSQRDYFYNILLSRAEDALYQAKLGGRNRVVKPSPL